MQTKPGAPLTIRLNFGGVTLADSWVRLANIRDTNYKKILLFNRLKTIQVPPAKNNINRSKVFDYASKKYDIFDINFTDENIPASLEVVITSRPTVPEFNALISDKSENGPWPYSYRRFLRGVVRPFPQQSNIKIQRLMTSSGVSWPSIPAFGNTDFTFLDDKLSKYILVWTNRSSAATNEKGQKRPDGGRDMGYQSTSFYPNEHNFPDILIGSTIAHEIGHRFGLDHDGAVVGGQKMEYYDGMWHDKTWFPIMGGTAFNIPFSQWSYGDYTNSTNKQDDIVQIVDSVKSSAVGNIKSLSAQLIKKPTKNMTRLSSVISTVQKFESFSNDGACWDLMSNNGFNIRTLQKNDVKTKNSEKFIEGMIGFPGDFDILKMVLPKGTYNFSVEKVQGYAKL